MTEFDDTFAGQTGVGAELIDLFGIPGTLHHKTRTRDNSTGNFAVTTTDLDVTMSPLIRPIQRHWESQTIVQDDRVAYVKGVDLESFTLEVGDEVSHGPTSEFFVIKGMRIIRSGTKEAARALLLTK